MSLFGVLAGKEIRELLKTLRVIILPAVFVFFGVAGPALIRLLPVILENAGTEELDMALPDFGPADGFGQFLELARQMGLLAVIIVYMGIVAGERREGLLATMFVKPVPRYAYVTTRWLVNGAYVLVSFLVGAVVAIVYTLMLLGRLDLSDALAATTLYASYVLLAFSWTTLFSAWMKSPPAAAGLSVLPLFALPYVGFLWEPLGDYGPYGAVGAGTAVLGMVGSASVAIPASAIVSAGVNLGLSGLAVVGACALLRRVEL